MSIDTRKLRHPLEPVLFTVFAALNLVVMAVAIFVAIKGADWLSSHPFLAKYSTHLRAVATAVILGPLGITFLRNARWAQIRGNSVAVSPQQLPQLYEIFLRQCQRLGIDPPELYFSDRAIQGPSQAYAAWKKEYIVLGNTFLQPDLAPMLPVFAFLMGRELGRLQLGHARWVNDLLLAYIARIPYLKNPLMRLFTYSEDRWGAFLAPESLPSGLVAMAAGRRMLPEINMADYLESVHGYSSVWAFLADWTSETPPIARRINALIDAGLVAAEGRAQGATSFTRQHR